MIRHFTSIDNTKNGEVIDPEKIKHGEVTALKLSNLSGFIDPQTHLNLDFKVHLVREVYLAEDLILGSKVILDGGRFMVAHVNPLAYKHLGFVDEADRAEELKKAVKEKILK